MKKIISMALSFLMISSIVTTSAFAASTNEYDYVGTYSFPLNSVSTQSEANGNADNPTVTITVYNDRGKNVYRMDTTASTAEEEAVAFEMFDQFVENGVVNEKVVTVDEYDTEFYGSETGRAGSKGSTGYNAYLFSWGRYLAGNVARGGYDKCWGNQAARWMQSGTSADYIKLHQSARINVKNADTALSISWPPSLDIDINTSSASVATWSSDTEYDTKSLAAQHETVEYNWEDLQGGNVTSFIFTDSADIKYGSTIYKPQAVIRFENGF